MKIKIEARVWVTAAVCWRLRQCEPLAAGKVCDVKKYGAKGDGTTKDTAAIQKAVDECSAGKGGGTVVLEAGTYVSAPILLKSNMTFELKKDATLLGSPDHDDYPEIQEFRELGHQALLSAVNAENVAITGEGTIDGNGASWWHMRLGRRAGVLADRAAGAQGAAGPASRRGCCGAGRLARRGAGAAAQACGAAAADRVRPLQACVADRRDGEELAILAGGAVLLGRRGHPQRPYHRDDTFAEHGRDRSVQFQQRGDRPCV